MKNSEKTERGDFVENKLERKYGLFTAICMVIGIVVGSGVFFKGQVILNKTGGDLMTGIAAWAIGGAIMLVCLLAFAFMGQKYEKVNGLVDYAEATMGKGYGYYMGWFATTIYYPSMTSVLAWVSARYTLDFLSNIKGIALTGPSALSPECMILAMFYLCVSYVINALSPKLAGKFQTSTTVIKLIPLLLMAIVGTIVGLVGGDQQLQQNMAFEALKVDGSPLFAAVCATAFAYEGWIIATSINSEIKDSKKNLPRALILGGIVIVAIYLFYFIGLAGGASMPVLMDSQKGAPEAFIGVFGAQFGNILNLFVAISCLGTLNGLMVGTTRGLYAIATRGEGPKPETFSQVDKRTNMPHNSAIIGLLVTASWLGYFYLGNLHPSILYGDAGSKLPFTFDSSELPIITIYAMYLPMFIMWMIKEKDQSVMRRFVMPILAFCGSAFMVLACVLSHRFDCVWYLIVFAVIMAIGALVRGKKAKVEE